MEVCKDVWMDGSMQGWIDEGMDGSMYVCMYGWMEVCKDEWMDGSI